MKIYVAHARKGFDYKKNLYLPLEHALRYHKVTFPYRDDKAIDSRKIIAECDLVIAEVSFPSTGLGIELGWANMYQVPILAIHKKNAKVSSNVALVAKKLIPYSTSQQLVTKIEHEIHEIG